MPRWLHRGGVPVDFRGSISRMQEAHGLQALDHLGVTESQLMEDLVSKPQKELSRKVAQVRYDAWFIRLDPLAASVMNSSSSKDKCPGASDWLTTAPRNKVTAFKDDEFLS